MKLAQAVLALVQVASAVDTLS